MNCDCLNRYYLILGCFVFFFLNIACGSTEEPLSLYEQYLSSQQSSSQTNASEGDTSEASTTSSNSFLLPDIDLTHWKVNLPIDNPSSVRPPEILNYATNEELKPFMYNDSIDGSLVFYTRPGETTPNATYSRTELREQMVSGSDHVNWTFAQGGRIRGELAVTEISQDSQGNDHRTIVMQIHGRLTDEQRELIGENDNNAPPILKIYWQNGQIRIKTKRVKDLSNTNEALLHTSAWEDDDGYIMPVEVEHERFTLEVIVTNKRMEVVLNDTHSKVYNNIHIEKWGMFENYFKAGNYLQTRDENAFARVKYYSLEVTH